MQPLTGACGARGRAGCGVRGLPVKPLRACTNGMNDDRWMGMAAAPCRRQNDETGSLQPVTGDARVEPDRDEPFIPGPKPRLDARPPTPGEPLAGLAGGGATTGGTLSVRTWSDPQDRIRVIVGNGGWNNSPDEGKVERRWRGGVGGGYPPTGVGGAEGAGWRWPCGWGARKGISTLFSVQNNVLIPFLACGCAATPCSRAGLVEAAS